MTQSKVIEIVVIGGTGSGKSHVLDVIDYALRHEYGPHVQIASHDLSCERGLGSPGEKPRVSDTIFNLREQGVPVGKATAGEIKEGLRNCSASREAYWAHAVGSAPLCSLVQPLAAIQGEASSFSLDPLAQAIESTVRMVRDEHQQMAEAGAQQDTALCDRLGSHLDALLAGQLKRVTADE